MRKTLAIYCYTAEGRIRVAEVSLNQDGAAIVTILDTPNAEEAKLVLGERFGSDRLERSVTLAEGELYLDAVRTTLRRATYWSAVDE
jgi:hypothetical protein